MQNNPSNPTQPQPQPVQPIQPVVKVAPMESAPAAAVPTSIAPSPTPAPLASPTPTPTPIAPIAPIVEDKPIDPSQLMFKTMPKGFDIPKNYVKPVPVAQVPAQPVQTVPGAPRPASSSYMVAPQGPAAPNTPDVPVAQTTHSGSSKTLWITLAVVLVLLIAAGAAWYFLIYSKNSNSAKNTPPSTQTTQSTSATNNSVANETTNSNTTPATGTNTTTATPPISQIPSSWMQKYFAQDLVNGVCPVAKQSVCGDSADADTDGLTNLQEYKDGTNPIVADTDGIGIADGDALNIFNLDPTTAHTGGNPNYSDAKDLLDKYNSRKHASFTDADLVQIAANITNFKLHQPTISTLGTTLVNFYSNYTSTKSPQPSQTQPSQ